MVLLGMVPVLMHTPPTHTACSTSATCLPDFAACIAARCPAGPEPITIISKVCMGLRTQHSKGECPEHEFAGGSLLTGSSSDPIDRDHTAAPDFFISSDYG